MDCYRRRGAFNAGRWRLLIRGPIRLDKAYHSRYFRPGFITVRIILSLGQIVIPLFFHASRSLRSRV